MGANMTEGGLTKNGGEPSSPKEIVNFYHLLVGRSLNHFPFYEASPKFRARNLAGTAADTRFVPADPLFAILAFLAEIWISSCNPRSHDRE
jgi:hypothetical protein